MLDDYKFSSVNFQAISDNYSKFEEGNIQLTLENAKNQALKTQNRASRTNLIERIITPESDRSDSENEQNKKQQLKFETMISSLPKRGKTACTQRRHSLNYQGSKAINSVG